MFRFTMSDLALFLGKSPSTLRLWERKGLVSFTRVGGKRTLSTDQLRRVAEIAHLHHRIDAERLRLITDAVSALTIIELENA